MDKLYQSLNNLKDQIGIPFWQNDETQRTSHNLTHLATPQILEIGNVLNAIVENIDWEETAIESLQKIKLETPKIVVVGTQSSGKSSVLNGILSLDMLPIGKNMVTRTPLHLQLIQTDGEMYVEFGNYNETQWQIDKKIKLTSPEPTPMEIDAIRQEIDTQTVLRAGSGMGISSKEIIIKFYSPYVPNLSLIDLPGLTMVACTDKGQPKDIKDQIRSLVSKYIQPDNSLILGVMSARTDLETDLALDLIKNYDPEGKRTIGVLTKIDLMNTDSHIADYLLGNISKDLRMKYGYFAVRNRSSQEMIIMTHQQGVQREMEYFNTHHVYSGLDEKTKERIGIRNLGRSLSQILINHIRQTLPELLSSLRELQQQMEKVVKDLGSSIPDEEDAKTTYLNSIINDFVKHYISSLEDRGATLNVGRRLKDTFDQFRQEMKETNPFNKDGYSTQYYQNVIRNCEGNHMSLFSLPIEVLEYCLRDSEKRPFQQLNGPAGNCLQLVSLELRQLIDGLIDHLHIERYPKFSSRLRDIVQSEVIEPAEEITRIKIQECLDAEEGYIWTHNTTFQDEMKQILAKSNTDNTELLRLIVEKYYQIVKEILEHSIPKVIMYFLVRQVEKNMYPILFNASDDLIDILQENPEEEDKRQKYRKCLKALQMANQIFEKI